MEEGRGAPRRVCRQPRREGRVPGTGILLWEGKFGIRRRDVDVTFPGGGKGPRERRRAARPALPVEGCG